MLNERTPPPFQNDKDFLAQIQKKLEPSRHFPYVKLEYLDNISRISDLSKSEKPQPTATEIGNLKTSSKPCKMPVPTNRIMFKCPICRCWFDEYLFLVSHLEAKHKKVPRSLPCSKCSSTFTDISDLLYHVPSQHPDKFVTITVCCEPITSSTEGDSTERLFVKTEPNRPNPNECVKTAEPIAKVQPSNYVGTFPKKFDLNPREITKNRIKFECPCPYCTAGFNTIVGLTLHKIRAHPTDSEAYKYSEFGIGSLKMDTLYAPAVKTEKLSSVQDLHPCKPPLKVDLLVFKTEPTEEPEKQDKLQDGDDMCNLLNNSLAKSSASVSVRSSTSCSNMPHSAKPKRIFDIEKDFKMKMSKRRKPPFKNDTNHLKQIEMKIEPNRYYPFVQLQPTDIMIMEILASQKREMESAGKQRKQKLPVRAAISKNKRKKMLKSYLKLNKMESTETSAGPIDPTLMESTVLSQMPVLDNILMFKHLTRSNDSTASESLKIRTKTMSELEQVPKSSTIPVLEISANPITDSSSTPVLKTSINHLLKTSTNPVPKMAISKGSKTSTKPVSATSINPVSPSSTNPVPKTSTNSVSLSLINPVSPSSTNPVPKTSTNSVSLSLINPVSPSSTNPVPKTSTNPVSPSSTNPFPKTSTNTVPKISISPAPKTSTKPVSPPSINPFTPGSTIPLPQTSAMRGRKVSPKPLSKTSTTPITKSSSITRRQPRSHRTLKFPDRNRKAGNLEPHSKELRHECKTCGLKFKSAYKLNLHYRKQKCLIISNSTTSKPFLSTDSNLAVEDNFGLTSRQSMIVYETQPEEFIAVLNNPSNISEFLCPLCPGSAGFTTSRGLEQHNLRAHQSIHQQTETAVINFRCTECGLLYKDSYGLKQHRKRCHTVRKTAIPPAKIGKRGKAKNNKSRANVTNLSHELDQHYLIIDRPIHQQTDTAVITFKCEECGLSHKDTYSLKQHRKRCHSVRKWALPQAKIQNNDVTNLESITIILPSDPEVQRDWINENIVSFDDSGPNLEEHVQNTLTSTLSIRTPTEDHQDSVNICPTRLNDPLLLENASDYHNMPNFSTTQAIKSQQIGDRDNYSNLSDQNLLNHSHRDSTEKVFEMEVPDEDVNDESETLVINLKLNPITMLINDPDGLNRGTQTFDDSLPTSSQQDLQKSGVPTLATLNTSHQDEELTDPILSWVRSTTNSKSVELPSFMDCSVPDVIPTTVLKMEPQYI